MTSNSARALGLILALATVSACAASDGAPPAPPGSAISIDAPMAAPRWAQMERQLLAENVPAAREFFQKYFDDRGYLLCFVRWGANDGPDDAFENFNQWPELHALGAGDEIVQMYLKGHEGMIKQYTEAKTTKLVPAGVDGMYYKEFSALSDWQHHGEGLQLFNRMALSVPADPKYLERVRRFSGFYMGEDPEAPNYDPKVRIIRSMMNGSKGPLLRKATSMDWVGEPFDMSGFDALHGERNFDEFLRHYQEYHDVVGDHALNLVATTLPANAYFATGEKKYKDWVVGYADAWIDRMKQNNGVIPTFVDLDGKIGGPGGKWWGSAYGWGFSPVNPVTGRRENRNRIERPIIGFNNALLLTGDQKYVDAWRDMTNAVNANARTVDGKTQYPSMYGLDLQTNPRATQPGWYGWRDRPWNVGALEVWYFSQKAEDLSRVSTNPWLEYLQGRNPGYPETAMAADLATIASRVEGIRKDQSKPDKRLADNMLDLNPVTTTALIQLTQGGMEPDRRGNLVNSRLRYFDPARRRAGLPEDVAALVSEMSDTGTVVTLVNVSTSAPRALVVQGGAYGEHMIESVDWNGKTVPVGKPNFTVTLSPGAGGKLTLKMKRYAGDATVKFPF
ncbi:MAG: hypothetical protein ABIS29_19140 [Vicinamibacterales bacterium]